MDRLIKELKEEFIKKKWEVQEDIVVKYRDVFDYKIPLIVKQKQIEYKIFYIPLGSDYAVRDAVVSVARNYKNRDVIVLTIMHPRDAKNMDDWILSRVALTTKHLWEIIHNDAKLHKYQKEILDLRIGIDRVYEKIKKLEETVAGRF